MTTPSVRFKLPDDCELTLVPGDIVGRLRSAAGRMSHPQVSEAHALVSLRGRELRLLALRGSLCVDGTPEDEVTLVPGLVVELVPGFALTVLEVTLPERVLSLELADQPPRELCASSYSLVLTPAPDLVPRYLPDAPAYVWSTSETWMIRVGRGREELIQPARSWTIDGVKLRALLMDVDAFASAPTETGPGAWALEIVARFSTVHVRRGRGMPFTIDGLEGRLLAELIALGAGPTPWELVAEQVWPGQPPRRKRWDTVLYRLRQKLREHGVRDTLARMDGSGNIELHQMPDDRVKDES